jgi:hypothetical protein
MKHTIEVEAIIFKKILQFETDFAKSKVHSQSKCYCSRHGFLHQRMNANGSDTK